MCFTPALYEHRIVRIDLYLRGLLFFRTYLPGRYLMPGRSIPFYCIFMQAYQQIQFLCLTAMNNFNSVTISNKSLVINSNLFFNLYKVEAKCGEQAHYSSKLMTRRVSCYSLMRGKHVKWYENWPVRIRTKHVAVRRGNGKN